MAALEFVLDNIGCSMGALFPKVVETLIVTFPICEGALLPSVDLLMMLATP